MSKINKMYEINKESLEEKQEQIEICLDIKDYQDIRSKRLLLRDSIIEPDKKKYNRKTERRKNKVKEIE